MNIRWHLRWLIVTGLGGLLIFAAVAFTALSRIQVNGPLYQQIALNNDLVADYVAPAGSLLPAAGWGLAMNDSSDPEEIRRYDSLLRAAGQDFERLHDSYMRRLAPGTLREAMQDAYEPGHRFFEIVRQEYAPLVIKGDHRGASALIAAPLKPLYRRQAAAVERIVAIARNDARTHERQATQSVRFYTGLMAAAGLFVFVAGGAFSVRIARGISTQAEELQRSFDELRALAGRLQEVREEERTRVSREIHDQLGQALTAIKIDVSALVRHQGSDADQDARRTSILKLVDETIQSVRRIATELRPGILDDLGLVATVEWAGEEFEARTGTACRLELPGDEPSIDPESATAVFRILQETLTNVARHAAASRVDVRLARDGRELTLEVRDNGRGMAADGAGKRRSLGILGMRERAMLLGGTLTITGVPGQGTTVRVSIPELRRA